MSGRELPLLGRAAGLPPGKAAEPDDPLALVGVAVPVDEATFDEMAASLVEEYVRLGWSDERLMALFRSPFYAGLHVIQRRRGEPWVRALIEQTRRRWRKPSRAPEIT